MHKVQIISLRRCYYDKHHIYKTVRVIKNDDFFAKDESKRVTIQTAPERGCSSLLLGLLK